MLINFSFKKPKTETSHSVIVALPLAVITVFCFAYVLTQPPQRLKKDETPSASQKPSPLTGDTSRSIDIDPVEADLQKLPPSEPFGTSNSQASVNSPSNTPTNSPQSVTTANPQAAAGASAAGQLDNSSTVQQQPKAQLKVLPGVIKNLLGGL